MDNGMQKSQGPMISVLMLTYNHARYISQAIESVLGQNTEFPIELIICDDASTDGTQEIIRKHAEHDPRIVLSIQPTNTKFGKNFVDGVSLVRGRYVAFCEGDDYWTSADKLQRQVSFLEQNPDFSVCAHKVQMFFMNIRQPSKENKYIYKDCTADDQRIKDGIFYVDESVANYYFQTGSLVLRWRFTNGFPDWFRQRMMFDHFMFMLHAVEGKIKYFDEVMSVWRRHGDGYTWLQTLDKGLFFQKEGADWIAMYQHMDEFFSKRFTFQIRERILLALRSIVQNCLETSNIDQLQVIVDKYESYFRLVAVNASIVDALRLVRPDALEFSPPWETLNGVESSFDNEDNFDLTTDAVGQCTADACTVDTAASLPDTKQIPALDTSIGGFHGLALEDIPTCAGSVWESWTTDKEYARFYNLRSALFRWLWQHGASTIWLPAYMPPILDANRHKCQFTRKFYSIGGRLEPSPDFVDAIRPGEAVLTINYLGRPLPRAFTDALAARKDIFWIEDLAQCLTANAEHRSHAAIFSPRKVLGVPDGGLLVGNGAQELEKWCTPSTAAASCTASTLLIDRFERPQKMNNSNQMRYCKHEMEHQLSRNRMSSTTEAILRRVPINPITTKRIANWQILYNLLGKYCLWQIPQPDFAPFAFPFLAPHNFSVEILHTMLSRNKILCQRMLWSPPTMEKNLYPLEESLARRLLLLPCDHRYSKKDMEHVASVVIRFINDPNFFRDCSSSLGVNNY